MSGPAGCWRSPLAREREEMGFRCSIGIRRLFCVCIGRLDRMSSMGGPADGGLGGSLQLGTPHDSSQQHGNRESGHEAGLPQSPPRPLLKDAEVYGFVGWIGTFVAYALFLLWAYVPEEVLHELGITYYPDKHWALTVPCFLFVAFLFLGVFYVSINLLSTAPLDSMHTLTDRFSRGVLTDGPPMGPLPSGLRAYDLPPGVPNIADLNIGVVNHLLYPPTAPSGPRAHRRDTQGGRSSKSRSRRTHEHPTTTGN